MVVAVRKTIYPDGRVKKYRNGMKVVAAPAPPTKEFNKWMQAIYNKLKRSA
jgi:hypothetical protein